MDGWMDDHLPALLTQLHDFYLMHLMAIQSDSQIANDIDKYNLKDTCITQQTILDHAALLSRSMKCVSLNKTITDTGRENYSGLKRLSSQ